MRAALVLTLALLPFARAGFDWGAVTSTSAKQQGDATYYGHQEGQDAQGTCSFSENYANTNSLPWTNGISTTIALNDAQFDNGKACGLCIMYRGTGSGIGTTPLATDRWYRGFVNNRCPECAHGDIDINIAGDGRWKAEWYAVPCNVGTSKLDYKIVKSSPYWFSMVVSNHPVPITDVQVKWGGGGGGGNGTAGGGSGGWVPLKRVFNNQWAYYSEKGPAAWPMDIRVTSVTGETVTDKVTTPAGNTGSVNFKETGGGSPGAGYPGKGVPPQNLPNKGSVGAAPAGTGAAAPAADRAAVSVASAAASGGRRLLLA